MNNFSIFKTCILIVMTGIAAATFLSSCKKGSDNKKEDTSKYVVTVNVEKFTTSGDQEYYKGMELVFPNGEDAPYIYTVENNETFSKTLTYNGTNITVGFVTNCILDENTPDNAPLNLSYDTKINISLCNEKGEVIAFKSFEDNNETEIENINSDEAIEAFMMHYIFKITENSIEKVEDNDDDNSTLPELPTHDDDDMKINGTMYYMNSIQTAEDKEYLYDNIVTRFNSVQKFSNQSNLKNGDFLFLFGNELTSVDHNILKQIISNGTILILDKINTYQSLQDFCSKLDIYNPVSENSDVTGNMYIIVSPKGSNFNLDGNIYRFIMFILDTTDSNGNKLESDYKQGVMIDNVTAIINNLLFQNSTTSTKSSMQDNIEAYKVYKIYHQNLNASDYYNPKIIKKSRSNVYTIEYDIWNLFNNEEKRNYYYIHQEFIGNFGFCYAGIYNRSIKTKGCKTIAKVCEWFCNDIEFKTESSEKDMRIHRLNPNTTVSSTSYSSGIDWGFGGGYSYNSSGGHTVSISGSLNITSSTTYSVQDVTIYNNSVPEKNLLWNYSFKRPEISFSLFKTSCTSMESGAASGYTTFNTGQDYLISFPETENGNVINPTITCHLKINLASTAGKCGNECAKHYKKVEFKESINLPKFIHSKQ